MPSNLDDDEALAAFERLYDPSDAAYQPRVHVWCAHAHLDAAAHVDRRRAETLLAGLAQDAVITGSATLARAVAAARPLVAAPAEVEGHFLHALDGDDARWPLVSAHVRFGYGAWLRRERCVVESRAHLRVARTTFEALGVEPFAERTRQELRATGEGTTRHSGWEHLASQEANIARLAAQGLTNEQIGEQLYLSHRTIGSHLYRIFPELGVASRAELAYALTAVDDGTLAVASE